MHLSLASVLAESARRFPDRTAVVEGTTEVSYVELWDMALTRGSALIELGVGPGDRIALLAPNGIDFVTAYYAVLAVGAAVVPIPPMLVADEIAQLLADSGSRLVLVDPELQSLLEPVVSATGVAAVVLRDRGCRDLASRAGRSEPLPSAVPREPLDPAVVFYTSGTTGLPKGAVLSHLNLVMNCFVNAFIANGLAAEDVVLGCLPLFHTFGQTVALNAAFLVGAKVVLERRFEGREALALMQRHRVSVMVGVPTMYMALLDALGAGQPPPLRVCICGGAPMPVAAHEEFETRFGCPVQEGYGLSETSPTASANQPATGLRMGSIGHPLWGVEVEIAEAEVEDRVELLEAGERGEIVVRGHNVFSGYLDNPAASAAALVDGWFRTGDIGIKDRDGFRYVIGRKKDMILRGGFNVYPRDIEEVLARHPAVAQVAVVGVPHLTHGEEVLAVVVPDRAAPAVTGEQLVEWSRERVAHHKRPRLVAFVDELPLGPTRKVLKRQLRDRFADLASRPEP